MNSAFIYHYKINLVGFKAFETLHYVALSLNTNFNIYLHTVNKVLVNNAYYSPVFNMIMTLNLRLNSDMLNVQFNNILTFIQKFKEQVYKMANSKILN